jgi:2-keto-3-deoxy-L-rhamnonate aldolase RhmA
MNLPRNAFKQALREGELGTRFTAVGVDADILTRGAEALIKQVTAA